MNEIDGLQNLVSNLNIELQRLKSELAVHERYVHIHQRYIRIKNSYIKSLEETLIGRKNVSQKDYLKEDSDIFRVREIIKQQGKPLHVDESNGL